MIKSFLIGITLFQLHACQSQTEGAIKEVNSIEHSVKEIAEPKISIDSLWNELVFTSGGCLTGGQHVRKGHFGSEGCVMTEERIGGNWKIFFDYPKDQLTRFLIDKFPDTTMTKIHTCPCMMATNGEVAVYALHYVYKKNWFDLNGFNEYSKREGTGCMDGEQAWLWTILANEEQRKLMSEQWLNELEK
jgi:hypothetical protein